MEKWKKCPFQMERRRASGFHRFVTEVQKEEDNKDTIISLIPKALDKHIQHCKECWHQLFILDDALSKTHYLVKEKEFQQSLMERRMVSFVDDWFLNRAPRVKFTRIKFQKFLPESLKEHSRFCRACESSIVAIGDALENGKSRTQLLAEWLEICKFSINSEL